MSTEQLPEPLNMAVEHIEELRGIVATRYADHTGEVHPSRVRRTEMEVASCDEAIDAILAEHVQRVTMQHHACDLERRIAELEEKCREWRDAEHRISNAYVGLRVILGAIDPPSMEFCGLTQYVAEVAHGIVRERDALSEELNEWRFTNGVDVMRRESDQLRHRAELEEQRCAVLIDADEPRTEQLRSARRERDELRAQVHIVTSERDDLAIGMQALRARLAEIEGQEPVAWVPVHPRIGELWANATAAPDPERLPSYPLRALYAHHVPAQPLPTGERQAVLQWQPVPQTLPPDPIGGWLSPYVWLAFEDGTVRRGQCLHKSANAAYSDPVHGWYVDDKQVGDDRNVVAWMLFAVPDHPGTIPALAANNLEVRRG